jgi:hypothetical protein
MLSSPSTLVLLLLSLPASLSQQLSLQPCNSSVAASVFSWGAGGSVPKDGNGACLGAASLAMSAPVTAQPCVAGSASQQWSFQAGGHISSVSAASLCFNVEGGSTAAGTPIALYTCGSSAEQQDHSLFKQQADGTILGLDSGLCLSSVPVPPAPPAPGNGSCSSAWDCTLNGECSAAGVCECYPPWTGSASCEALAFAPSPVQRGFPAPGHNETSWGGSIVLDPVGGQYHMYVAEMMNECPLSTWGQNSRCTHAVSATPEGPYSFESVAVQNWCHNPAIVRQSFANGSALYALFHIGSGTGGATKNCTAGAAGSQSISSRGSSLSSADSGSSLHVSSSPSGPFLPVSPLPSCNNPAPWLHSNGTWFIICNGFELYSAETVYGPWTHLTTVRSSAGMPVPGNYEDPFFFVDARSNWQ